MGHDIHAYEPHHRSLYWRILVDPKGEWIPEDIAYQVKIAKVLACKGEVYHGEQIATYIERMTPEAQTAFAENLHKNKSGLTGNPIIQHLYGSHDVTA